MRSLRRFQSLNAARDRNPITACARHIRGPVVLSTTGGCWHGGPPYQKKNRSRSVYDSIMLNARR